MSEAAAEEHRNEVVLVAEVTVPPEERLLADGTPVMTFRVEVARDADLGSGRDSVECTARAGRLRRSLAVWEVGDLVEITGALRRRFYRVGQASRPFVVVEVDRARRVASAATRRRRLG